MRTPRRAKTSYGTVGDPEYLPLSHRSWLHIGWFLLQSLFIPVLLVLRYGLVTPLSIVVPPLRRLAVGKMSSLAINPAFTRQTPRQQDRATWWLQELACFAWVWLIAVALCSGVVAQRSALISLAVVTGAAFSNQLRTLAAHLWDNEHGEELSVEQQLLDTVNVPGPSCWASLWAPLGLRYHALHHLIPGIPYHNLGAAHRRVLEILPSGSYKRTMYDGLADVLGSLFRRSSQRTERHPTAANAPQPH